MAGVSNESGTAIAQSKPKKNIIGWAGFIVTIGILLEQIYTHGVTLTHFISLVFSGRLAGFLRLDPFDPSFYMFSNVIELVNAVFFFIYPVIILIFLFMRKKFVPRLLVIFAAVAGVYNIVHIIMLEIAPEELKAILYINIIDYVVFIVVDILLLLYFFLSKRFRSLFTR